MTSRGVVVKYNPCSVHARQIPCPYFQGGKKCDKLPLECEMPEYDRWFRDVLDGKMKCFYPNRIPLLENSGIPMFLFHTHHHAILGEAEIVETTRDEGKHFYWFEEFISYSNPVQLELIRTDLRLPSIAIKGRWRWINIREETTNEIRRLSELSEQKKKELEKDLQIVIDQMKKRLLRRRPVWEVYIREECEKLSKSHEIDEQIFAKTQEFFTRAIKEKVSVGHSYPELFYASLYLAFRMSRVPKLFNDIVRMSDANLASLRKHYLLLASKFELTVPLLDPKQLVLSRSDELGVSRNIVRRAVSLVEEAKKRRITEGKAPSSIAAAAIFVACQEEGENIRQNLIAKTFDVSTVTIRKYSCKLKALYTACH